MNGNLRKSIAADPLRTVCWVQGAYYIVTGMWPLLHIDSFQVVTGPKDNLWLVKTVGLFLIENRQDSMSSTDPRANCFKKSSACASSPVCPATSWKLKGPAASESITSTNRRGAKN